MMRSKKNKEDGTGFRARLKAKLDKLESEKSRKETIQGRLPASASQSAKTYKITEKVDEVWIRHMEEYLVQIRGWGGIELKELESRRQDEGKPLLKELLENTRREKDKQKRGEMAMEAWKDISAICIKKTGVIKDEKVKMKLLNEVKNAYDFEAANIVARKELVYHIDFYKYQFVKAFEVDPEVTEHMQAQLEYKRKLAMGEYDTTSSIERERLKKAIEEEEEEIQKGILAVYFNNTPTPGYKKYLDKRHRSGADPTILKFFSYYNEMMDCDKAGNYSENKGMWEFMYGIAYQAWKDKIIDDEKLPEDKIVPMAPPPLIAPCTEKDPMPNVDKPISKDIKEEIEQIGNS